MSEVIRHVWVTKYALSTGIVGCVVDSSWTSKCSDGGVYVKWDGGLNGVLKVSKSEYADKLEEAQAQVKAEATRKLASLDKQRAKIEKIVREGAKWK
jgi:hypothetical protein